jgi:hypothetical protein
MYREFGLAGDRRNPCECRGFNLGPLFCHRFNSSRLRTGANSITSSLWVFRRSPVTISTHGFGFDAKSIHSRGHVGVYRQWLAWNSLS